MRCKHYQVTFDSTAPRGCKLYQFKTASMPSILVKQSTGHDCTSFEEKIKTSSIGEVENGIKKIDFNDPKYWG